jgi:hypothetical protein
MLVIWVVMPYGLVGDLFLQNAGNHLHNNPEDDPPFAFSLV